MGNKRNSPEAILPTRMTLQIPAESEIRFSVLDFPYEEALRSFMDRFAAIYKRKHNVDELPYSLRPPRGQLNDAILALAPGLIQAFEYVKDGDEYHSRMVTFTHYREDGLPQDVPTLGQLRSLIRHWLELWGEKSEVREIIAGDGKQAWETLLRTVEGNPETEWRHGITPLKLVFEPNSESGLAYVALPALLSALLHGKQMELTSEKGSYLITWRRANDGGKNGLYLVTNPLPYNDDYFAYCLDFSVQTQAGYVDERGESRLWVFAHLSIRRYITETLNYKGEGRTVSVLVGCNRNRFFGGWEHDTTLINLGVQSGSQGWQWESGVERLLDSFSTRKLMSPNDLFSEPFRYAHYLNTQELESDEYYIVYAEGRRFGSERERKHQVKTGTSLRERSQIIEGVLSLLGGWLLASPPLKKDVQNPENTFALRDYEYMVSDRKDQSRQRASWRTALDTALESSGHSYLHIVVLYRTEFLRDWARQQIAETLMGVDEGNYPLVTVTCEQVQPTLYHPLDTGYLPPDYMYWPRSKKTKTQTDKWNKLMVEQYSAKREIWRDYIRHLNWQPNARRLLLIESTGETKQGDLNIHPDRKVKGAIRDACHREGVLAQFIVGERLKLDTDSKRAGKLHPESDGKLQNAVLDLIVRQQGILYAAPSQIYELAAELNPEIAEKLDVVAFCRVERNSPVRLRYVLAVRLRANGEVSVILPHQLGEWLPYTIAAHEIGILFSNERSKLFNHKAQSLLRLGHQDMLYFVHNVLTKHLERPTLAVIEAEGWRNSRGKGESRQCWTQLQNGALYQHRDVLRFDNSRVFSRNARGLENLLGVVRLRMNSETPQYVTADNWAAEEVMRDVPHLTGYVDTGVSDLLHFFSLAGKQDTQNEMQIAELFRGDIKHRARHDIAYRHPQLIEMVPFFVHSALDNDVGKLQLCRCIHFLRISPAFTNGEIIQPYPMHLGETLIEDQLAIVNADA
ncbi:MAG: DUF3962 domain-containing protein [Anaerolineae bacterium]|nr:DUF3962 domain-containing protein [Anaerolineae bacterium]